MIDIDSFFRPDMNASEAWYWIMLLAGDSQLKQLKQAYNDGRPWQEAQVILRDTFDPVKTFEFAAET